MKPTYLGSHWCQKAQNIALLHNPAMYHRNWYVSVTLHPSHDPSIRYSQPYSHWTHTHWINTPVRGRESTSLCLGCPVWRHTLCGVVTVLCPPVGRTWHSGAPPPHIPPDPRTWQVPEGRGVVTAWNSPQHVQWLQLTREGWATDRGSGRLWCWQMAVPNSSILSIRAVDWREGCQCFLQYLFNP